MKMTGAAGLLSVLLGSAILIAGPLHGGALDTPQGQTASTGTVVMRAHADVKGEGISGTAELTEVKSGTATEVEIEVSVKGLKPGLHGMHFHAVGVCDPPSFTTAGGHFDPGPFGNPDADLNHPYHMGDLPNLEVGPDGVGRLKARTTRVTLSDGPLSVFDADGTALIIHANPDQGISGEPKSGVAGGPRAACGVIVKK